MPDYIAFLIRRLIPALLLFPSFLSLAQQSDSSSIYFCKVIQSDSVMMFFNQRNHFIEKECAEYTRYVRIDANGDFNSYFEDWKHDSLLVGLGGYVHGVRQGYFETYYENGKVKSKGGYHKGIPTGVWEYYYENGLPERTIRFTDTDTLLLRLIDEKANLKVIDGNGTFYGKVAGLSYEPYLIATGRIVDGKPDGTWTSTLDSNPYRQEQFIKGKYIKGGLFSEKSKLRKGTRSHLNTFLLNDYMTFMEMIKMEHCADSALYRRFELSPTVRIIFERELRKKAYGIFRTGDAVVWRDNHTNKLTVRLTIDDHGKAQDFELLTPWGTRYMMAITETIKKYIAFPQNPRTMYFHFVIYMRGSWAYPVFYFSDQAGTPLE